MLELKFFEMFLSLEVYGNSEGSWKILLELFEYGIILSYGGDQSLEELVVLLLEPRGVHLPKDILLLLFLNVF